MREANQVLENNWTQRSWDNLLQIVLTATTMTKVKHFRLKLSPTLSLSRGYSIASPHRFGSSFFVVVVVVANSFHSHSNYRINIVSLTFTNEWIIRVWLVTCLVCLLIEGVLVHLNSFISSQIPNISNRLSTLNLVCVCKRVDKSAVQRNVR